MIGHDAVALDHLAQESQKLLDAGQLLAAENLLRPWVAQGTGPIMAWALLAKTLRYQGRAEEALLIQKMLVETIPGNFGFRFDFAETLLLLGQFERGWREYHHRYSMPHTAARQRRIQRPRWNGRPVPGKTLLIHDEQGFGDSFQFMRMVAWAKERSQAHVIFDVCPEIHPLAQRLSGYDQLNKKGDIPPSFDVHCELMSLPMLLGFDMANLPGTMPYMTPEPARLARWQQRLADLPRPLVAISWAGRPIIYNGQNRAATLADLAPLAESSCTFLSIQKGEAAAEARTPPPGMNLVSLSDEIADFEDTAAILGIADLLITNDSAPAHLAGAMNRPAWVMLPFVADWRWQLNRADSPWYPSLRLFRQRQAGQWGPVVAEIAEHLTRSGFTATPAHTLRAT